MKLWLDDARPAPDGWTLARNFEEAVSLLAQGTAVEASLDYDLYLVAEPSSPSGLAVATVDDQAKTGLDVALWIEEAITDGRIPALALRCHSTNPEGRRLITAVIARIPCPPP